MVNSWVIITDTGKRSVSSSTAEETDLANNGNPLTLYGVEVTYSLKTLTNTKPIVGKLSNPSDSGSKFAFGEATVNGLEIPHWTVRGVLKANDPDQLVIIKTLVDFCKTKGVKTLSCDIADAMNGTLDNSVVYVVASQLSITHRSNSGVIEYQLVLFETS